MAGQSISRRLAVIVHADVVGSTTLVQRDETLAHRRINDAFQRFASIIREYGGSVHEVRGDALVAEFSRASDAVGAVLGFQQSNVEHNARLDDGIVPVIRAGVALQDDVTEKIVSALSVKLTEEQRAQLAKRYTDDPLAYDYFLRGQALFSRYEAQANAEAREMYLRAINLDPDFARAPFETLRTPTLTSFLDQSSLILLIRSVAVRPCRWSGPAPGSRTPPPRRSWRR